MSLLEKDNRYIFWRHDDKPTIFMMVGLAGSGKSDLASRIYCENKDGIIEKPIVHSSDALRLELFGEYDDGDPAKKEIIFKTIKQRIKNDLNAGKNVIYDATNLNTKVRAQFLSEIKKTGAYKQCIMTMTPYEECIKRNENREHVVPKQQIKRTYMTFSPPGYHEGWDNILPVYNYESKDFEQTYQIDVLLNKMDKFDQESSHHTMTLGGHCRYAMQYVNNLCPEDRTLQLAAVLHDCGKLNTKTTVNAKGEDDGQSHYYQHQCVGAYESMFYLKHAGVSPEEQLDISNLIYYHMHPRDAWDHSKRAANKAMNFIGEKLYDRIMILHKADMAAHKPSKIRESKNIHGSDIIEGEYELGR